MNENHPEGKSYMARRNLYDIYKNVKKLLETIKEGETLDDCMEHKISTSRSAISDVASAFSYDKEMEDCGCDSDESDEVPEEMDTQHMSDTPDTIIRKVISFGEWVKKTKNS